MATRKKTYNVTAKLLLEVNIQISANSLEDAVNESKTLRETDFVKILGDYNNGDMKVNGVFEEYKSIEL